MLFPETITAEEILKLPFGDLCLAVAEHFQGPEPGQQLTERHRERAEEAFSSGLMRPVGNILIEIVSDLKDQLNEYADRRDLTNVETVELNDMLSRYWDAKRAMDALAGLLVMHLHYPA